MNHIKKCLPYILFSLIPGLLFWGIMINFHDYNNIWFYSVSYVLSVLFLLVAFQYYFINESKQAIKESKEKEKDLLLPQLLLLWDLRGFYLYYNGNKSDYMWNLKKLQDKMYRRSFK